MSKHRLYYMRTWAEDAALLSTTTKGRRQVLRDRKVHIDLAHIHNRVIMAKQMLNDITEKAEQAKNDTRKADRLSACECVTCYYLRSRMGGNAIVERECGVCGKVMMFGNTSTDELCPDCAAKMSLCKHCGADINLKMRRTL